MLNDCKHTAVSGDTDDHTRESTSMDVFQTNLCLDLNTGNDIINRGGGGVMGSHGSQYVAVTALRATSDVSKRHFHPCKSELS